MFDYFLLILSFVFLIILPGYLLGRIILPKKILKSLLTPLSPSNSFIIKRYFHFLFAPALGLVALDFTLFFLNKINQAISRENLFLTFLFLNGALIVFDFFLTKKEKEEAEKEAKKKPKIVLIFLGLFVFAVTLRTVFYLPDVVPQNTDLGHHSYWAELLVQNEKIPEYDTPEVIVGEHLIFGSLGKLSGVSLLSSLTLILLAFYNFFLILIIPAVSLVVFNRKIIALFSFSFCGVYFAIDSPQAKFVRGGVIGNTFGNLFIVLTFFVLAIFLRFFWKKLQENGEIARNASKRLSHLVSLIIFILGGALYTHHLSAFLLIFCLFFFFISLFLATVLFFYHQLGLKKAIFRTLLITKNLLFEKSVIFFFCFLLIMLFFVYTPSYLETQAISTVARKPLKESHLGVSFSSAPDKFGKIRLGLTFLAMTFMFFASFKSKIDFLKKDFSRYRKILPIFWTFFFSWSFPLFVLTFTPWLFIIDLPSQRVINYLLFPSIFLAGFGLFILFSLAKKNLSGRSFLITSAFFIALAFFEGTVDFRNYFTWENKFQETVELYEASKYLRDNSKKEDAILKDHVSLVGDAWIKFFLLRGYDYFTSRTYDYKYVVYDPYNPVDTCPKDMIDVPESKVSLDCYGQTGISYVILRPKGEKFFFFRAMDFNTIYESDSVSIFKK